MRMEGTSGGLAGFGGGLDTLAGEVVGQLLDGVHARVGDAALGDLGHCRERHAGLGCDRALRDRTGTETRHHVVVEVGRSGHARMVDPYMGMKQYPHMN